MKRILLGVVFLAGVLSTIAAGTLYKRTLLLMGSDFEITVMADNSDLGEGYIDMAVMEIQRIEQLISSWDPNSQTSAINKNAGIQPVKVDVELFKLIERAKLISILSDGAFDISYASMDRIWKFDGSMVSMPSVDVVKASIQKVGYEKIQLDSENQTVFLSQQGMKIGFGGIGKGYAADKAKELLKRIGVKAGIINASGDMSTWGTGEDGAVWKIAITNPKDKDKAFGMLSITDKAVVTSGDYEKFVSFNGTRYSHIINPKTGYPCQGIISVTVLAPKAEMADALATSIFVMGIEVGLDRINQIPQVECIIIDAQGNVHQSNNIEIQPL